jgi:gluconolactonase
MCEITGRVSRLTLTNSLVVDAVADYSEHTLKFPNDLVILADGTIFFSDSKVPRIFRIDPAGHLHVAVPKGAGDAGANGLALSPDQKTLYATYTQEGMLRAFDISTPDRATGPQVVARTENLPDGLCVDSTGNLYVGTAAGVQVLSPTGKSLGVRTLPTLDAKDRVTKCVFGGADGHTLFVLVPGKLFRVPAKIAGWTAPQPDSP